MITVAFVPGFARVARAQTLSVKQEPYVEAAISMGVRTPVIIFRHIVPNIMAPIVALMTLWVASAIRLEASLSFLGIGTQAPNPSWGNIIRDGLNSLFGSPWPIIAAGTAITLVVLSFNLVGDAVRDALDPTTAGRHDPDDRRRRAPMAAAQPGPRCSRCAISDRLPHARRLGADRQGHLLRHRRRARRWRSSAIRLGQERDRALDHAAARPETSRIEGSVKLGGRSC